ncbi:hypothetical protein MIND_00698600 [Mycena indigotica]|uniref:Uncharacterized protein n=1 Tax=Mycena indigotica TaxID=2126181 RepID=A0A8H6W0T9_9AGAR|nr:uncharacterized protein MIND_00698600 [Mycena indigotica]KAF7301334.1 hypothetical protein MIND_00698600 [Mycena indigotica]
MHSPDPDSGSSSPVSDTPPDEHFPAPPSGSMFLTNLTSHFTSSFTASAAKRRLPTGGSFAASSSRDVKTRRREDPRRGGGWEGKEGGAGGKRDKEELIDGHIVEGLRKEIGDPFNEAALKAAS